MTFKCIFPKPIPKPVSIISNVCIPRVVRPSDPVDYQQFLVRNACCWTWWFYDLAAHTGNKLILTTTTTWCAVHFSARIGCRRVNGKSITPVDRSCPPLSNYSSVIAGLETRLCNLIFRSIGRFARLTDIKNQQGMAVVVSITLVF